MKSTGIVRKVDELGRVVLPIELRRSLELDSREPMEIFVEGDTVFLRKYRQECIFCDETEEIVSFRGKSVCPACIRRMSELM